ANRYPNRNHHSATASKVAHRRKGGPKGTHATLRLSATRIKWRNRSICSDSAGFRFCLSRSLASSELDRGGRRRREPRPYRPEPEQIEPCEPGVVADDGLAVDQTGSHGKPAACIGSQRKTIGKVIAVNGQALGFFCFDDDPHRRAVSK